MAEGALTQRQRDEAASVYNPASNGYRLDKDPRCLFGWGPPEFDCFHRFGHACFRAFGHPGLCWDSGQRPDPDHLPCEAVRRPKDWDSRGREKANR